MLTTNPPKIRIGMTASGKMVMDCSASLLRTPNIMPKRYPDTANITKIPTILEKEVLKTPKYSTDRFRSPAK